MRRALSLPASIPWSDFAARLDWRQGEHVSLIGPTGSGKTTLGLALLPRRRFVTVLGTKPRDATLDELRRRHGYRRIREWPPRPGEERVLLWPPLDEVTDWRPARDRYAEALRGIYRQRNWCVFVDEARVVCDERRPFLGLAGHMRLLWTQGRSLGVSIVAGTQRPAWVPPEMYDQATHLFFWRDNDHETLRRLGGLGGLDARTIRETVAGLGQHEALYVNTRDGTLARTRVEL